MATDLSRPVGAKADVSATGHSGVCLEESLARLYLPLPQLPPGASSLDLSLLHHALTEMAVFTEARTDPADGPKEPPQSVRFVFGKGCVGHYEEGSRGA